MMCEWMIRLYIKWDHNGGTYNDVWNKVLRNLIDLNEIWGGFVLLSFTVQLFYNSIHYKVIETGILYNINH